METQNISNTITFTLQGITENLNMKIPLFIIFFHMYLIALAGNTLIIALVCLSPVLHKPMYFFICNLSFIDISYTTVTQPKLLSMLLTGDKTIPFAACLSQLYFFLVFTCAEVVLLTVMAYDRYVAICRPMSYSLVMSRKTCIFLCAVTWIISVLDPTFYTTSAAQADFCESHLINHFYCDPIVVLKLSCEGNFSTDIMTYVFGSLVTFCALVGILISYVYIIIAILKIKSAEGRQKTISTCVSHLTIVILYYGTIVIIYTRPISQSSSSEIKPFSVVYTILIPVINPFVYTLRNKEVKDALWKAIPMKKRSF